MKNISSKIHIFSQFFILFSVLILSLGFNNIVLAQPNEIFILNKQNLLNEAKNNTPTLQRIKSSSLTSSLNKNRFLENFQPQLEGDVSYFETNEIPAIEFAPTVSPITKSSIGVKKDFTTGMSFGAYNKFQKQNFGSLGIESRNSLALEFSMDLYKDLFGKDSKSRLSYFEYEEKIAKMKKDIDEEIFLITLNRIYYSLIFNQEAINISNKILEIYKKQAIDTKNRYKNGIADLSQVNRSLAQVASKEVDILNLNNNKENLILNLKKLLPSIAASQVQLFDYKLDNESKYFSKILEDIEKQKETPMQYTYYDDIINLIEKSYQKQTKFTNNYSDVDLEFYSAYEHFGKNQGVRTSVDNTYKDAQDAYQVGVRLNVPIGSVKSDSKELELALQKANFLANKSENMAKIQAQHTQSIRNLKLLESAKIYQDQNSKNLNNILKISEVKYKQARIPLKDLIEDQDFYLQSKLREIDIKMSIINQIFDYLEVFTNSPFSLSNGQNN